MVVCIEVPFAAAEAVEHIEAVEYASVQAVAAAAAVGDSPRQVVEDAAVAGCTEAAAEGGCRQAAAAGPVVVAVAGCGHALAGSVLLERGGRRR